MKALIDADILPYEFGGMVQLEEPSQPLAWEIVRGMVDDRVNQILEATGSTEKKLFLTDSKSNFRLGIATIKPYKGHRATEKPYHWAAIRQHLIDEWDAHVQYGIEADDRLGIEQMLNKDESGVWRNCDTVICSRDKDMHMIPGWHYVWPCGYQQEEMWFQDEVSAIRCFYKQLLTGDTSDNILGLYNVGGKSQLVKSIEEMEEEQLMFNLVFKAYEDRFGSYAEQFLYENAALLWIKRSDEDEWDSELEVYNRLAELQHNDEIQEEEQTESTSRI